MTEYKGLETLPGQLEQSTARLIRRFENGEHLENVRRNKGYLFVGNSSQLVDFGMYHLAHILADKDQLGEFQSFPRINHFQQEFSDIFSAYSKLPENGPFHSPGFTTSYLREKNVAAIKENSTFTIPYDDTKQPVVIDNNVVGVQIFSHCAWERKLDGLYINKHAKPSQISFYKK